MTRSSLPGVAPAKRVPAGIERDSAEGAKACATTVEPRRRSPVRIEAQQVTATKAALAKRTLLVLVLDARAWLLKPLCAGATLPRTAEKEDGTKRV